MDQKKDGGGLEHLRKMLLKSAAEFKGDDPGGINDILKGIALDMKRGLKEALEIFPVCHHSPASASFMAMRLLEKRPKVIFMEMCEDLYPLIEKLVSCDLPVTLQAFASETQGFPETWSPLSVVTPLTEFSAEYQCICYALKEKDCSLIFVDRSVDHIYQWMQEKADPPNGKSAEIENPPDDKPEIKMHGSSIGIAMGDMTPRAAEFRELLLKNANVRHYSEWWDQYVEEALIGKHYETYREVMCLIGSLYRRLKPDNPNEFQDDIQRERYMWTRMKQYLKEHKPKISDCLYVCGAFHAVSDVPEFGMNGSIDYTISPDSGTKWHYGIIPSSFSAIEWQFQLPYGAISIAGSNWKRTLKKLGLSAFELKGAKTKKAKTPGIKKKKVTTGDETAQIIDFFKKAPAPKTIDEAELISWCVGIVHLSRKNGYLASSADAIAIYQTAILLSNMRNRNHPTPYDFQDAAITCLEKDMTPKKRNVKRLCEILLGGDRIGKVGFDSLPPLAKDVVVRLNPLKINLEKRTLQRVLMDFSQDPHLVPASDLLWKLKFLLDDYAVRPIMGERSLGLKPKQESWDIAIGKYQRHIIELGYEGLTVEHVLEKRLRETVYGPKSTCPDALKAVEESILYLDSHRLTRELGERAVLLIKDEKGIMDATVIFRRIRKLLHYYRSLDAPLPKWVEAFIAEGYSHFATMLPEAFADQDVPPDQVGAMLGFIFTLEKLALSLGCTKEQFVIAIKQSDPILPAKISLLWTAEFLLFMKKLEEIRLIFDDMLENPLLMKRFPDYLSGFIIAFDFTPLLGTFIVELLSKAFEKLPDAILLPFLPGLVMTLKNNCPDMMPALLKEASNIFPLDLPALETWHPPWEGSSNETHPINKDRSPLMFHPASRLLMDHPDTTNAFSQLLGLKSEWTIEDEQMEEAPEKISQITQKSATLLSKYPDTSKAIMATLEIQ